MASRAPLQAGVKLDFLLLPRARDRTLLAQTVALIYPRLSHLQFGPFFANRLVSFSIAALSLRSTDPPRLNFPSFFYRELVGSRYDLRSQYPLPCSFLIVTFSRGRVRDIIPPFVLTLPPRQRDSRNPLVFASTEAG